MTHTAMDSFKTALLAKVFAAAVFLTVFDASAANVSVNLTAQKMSTALPDGSTAPMWGFCATPASGDCSGSWAPGPTIVAAAGDMLTITLKNSLLVPTSIVILGQIGGTVGTPSMVPSPPHNMAQPITWPSQGAAGHPPFTPPP